MCKAYMSVLMTITLTTLSNGLRIVTDPVPSVESAAVGVWCGVGARDENLIYNGTAHMVEHMLFKGTQTRSALDIANVIENVGGHMNAYTSREITSYHIHLLKDDVALALDVLSDLVQNSTMPEDEIARERSVILQEIGMCNDTPDDVIFDNYTETAYPKQTIGAPILGRSDIIEKMQRAPLMDYMKTHYMPQNLVICVSGNIVSDDIIQYVTDLFGDLPDDKKHKRQTPLYEGGECRVERDLEQSHIVFGFPSPARIDNDFIAGQLLSGILGGGMSSRLFQEVREKRGLVYSIYSFNSAYSDHGQFTIYAGTGPDKLPELVPVMCDEIMKSTESITSQEINRVKAQVRSSVLMARESMMNRADQHAKDVLLRGRVRHADEIIDGINSVDMNMIRTVAQKIFKNKPTLAALGPLGQLESYDDTVKRLVA